MIYKKNTPAKQQVKKVPVSTIDLSKSEVSQDVAERTVCVYGATDNAEKWKKKFHKYGNVEQIVEERFGIIVTYSSKAEASTAIKKIHSKNEASGLVVCRDFAPPILASGHKPNIFVIRDVPDDVSLPQIWEILNGDNCCISHISFLPTLNRHIIILCEDKDGQQALMEKNGTRLSNWRVKVELWLEFCFQMTRKNVVLVENIPGDSTVDSLKKLLGVHDGIEYIQIVQNPNCALVFCKSKDIVNLITFCGQDQLRISMYQNTAGCRYLAFIDNLHEMSKDSDVLKHFDDCGKILKVNVSLDQKTGLKRAVIYFENEDGVENAVEKNGSELMGQTIKVSRSLNKKSSNSVFVTNLHRGATGLHLCLIFQDCGHIESVHVPKQKNIVNGREAGVVVFRDPESIPKALEKSNKNKIRGMRIVVHKEDPYEHRGKRGKSRKNKKRTAGGQLGDEKPAKRRKEKEFGTESHS